MVQNFKIELVCCRKVSFCRFFSVLFSLLTHRNSLKTDSRMSFQREVSNVKDCEFNCQYTFNCLILFLLLPFSQPDV